MKTEKWKDLVVSRGEKEEEGGGRREWERERGKQKSSTNFQNRTLI